MKLPLLTGSVLALICAPLCFSVGCVDDEKVALGGAATGGASGTGGAPGAPVYVDEGGGGVAGTDATSLACLSDKDCVAAGLLCDPVLHYCASCITSSDCPAGVSCESGACVQVKTCNNSLECDPDTVCVKAGVEATGVCQECGTSADCGGTGSCVAGVCAIACASDKDCTALGMLCDGSSGTCGECGAPSDCGDGETCSGGKCQAAVCWPSSAECLGDSLLRCREDGAGYEAAVVCEDGCAVDGGEVTCTGDDSTAGSGGNSGDPDPSGVLLPNGNFDSGTAGWALSGGAPSPTPTVKNGAICESIGSYTLGWPAGDATGLTLSAGSYTLSFHASVGEADPADSIEVKLALADEPYDPVYFTQRLENLSGTNDSYSYVFEVSGAATNVGLAFNVSGIEAEVCFDDVVLTKN